MRTVFLTLSFALALGTGALWQVASDSAMAVVQPQSVVPTEQVEPAAKFIVRLDIPISWQVTRANFLRKGVAARTESFRETWTLEIRPQGESYLVSPRAEVPVYRSGVAAGGDAMPASIVLLERDFARLIGVGRQIWRQDLEAEDEKGQLVTFFLSRPPKGGIEMNLYLSEEEHYAVHVALGTAVMF